ncbi:MAG: hypothetical protein DRP74_05060 [Candidatus Omnitrophota bacterium]|nr:MAG: hypothetical protein DRP74_05060 [Candidatus Omnitrophota bacterium]
MLKKKLKVLILDDEKDICEFVRLLFRKKGYLVYKAFSGNKAVSLAKKVKPDIALLDIYLKRGVSGIDVLSRIKGVAPLCQCVMVTWDSAKEKIKEARKSGSVAYLTKPLTIEQLFKVVNRIAKNIAKRGKHG